ncbi:MAG: hypothetical protein PHC28_06725 [Flavobacterium sp.]|uniref:hypothetical protein n=1 Tax=Flavobacterium sp. TaxID=239 RepID=UPI00262789A8|nr:hypothetical protein [Flavobacterium sp.]MDD5150164.1 hypothetical protein [Flavobacterium sp.]
MVSGIDYEELRADFTEYTNRGVSTNEMLSILDKIDCQYIRYIDTKLFYNRLYIITVPSLNVIAGNHCIVIDTRKWTIDDMNIIVHDPQKGNIGEKYYDIYSDIKSWAEVVEIVL